MPGEATAGILHAFRISRRWDKGRMARELHRAAVSIGESVAEHDALVRMIRAWEAGSREPTERYLLLYRHIEDEQSANGTSPDPAAVLKRARHAPSDDEIAAITDPAARAEIRDLKRTVDALSRRLEELLGGDRDE